MRTQITATQVVVWISARETYDWAHRADAAWPCSRLSNKRLCATFDNHGLSELTVDGRSPSDDLDGTELSAICADHLARALPKDHPAYFVAVEQFRP